MTIRDDANRRYNKRRNGQSGLGPFTIDTREEMLERLLAIQDTTQWQLVNEKEINYIKEQWRIDSQ